MSIESQQNLNALTYSRVFLVRITLSRSITNAIAVRFNLLTMAWQPEQVLPLP